MAAVKTAPPGPLEASLARIAKHAQPANEVKRREDKVRHRAMLAAAQRRGVPAAGPIWEAVRGREVADTAALSALGEGLAAGRALVVLSGCAGAGKSVALAWHVMRSEAGALLVHAVRLAEALCAPREPDRAELAERAFEAPLLAIDDAGLEAGAGAAFAISSLLCRRVDAGRPTVIASNLDERAFRARYLDDEHGRLASRFAASGAFHSLEPVDYRRAPAELVGLKPAR